jgi:tetratricopeptide (TPR) repeat protein
MQRKSLALDLSCSPLQSAQPTVPFYTETPGGMPLRFSMLEIIREYALERLQASDEAEGLRRRHAAYYAHLVEDPLRMGPTQDARDEAIAREALALAQRIRDHGGKGNALALLGAVAEARGDLTRATSLLEESLFSCRQAGDTAAIVRALMSLGHIAAASGDDARARACFEEALAYTRALGITWGVAAGLTSLGHLARKQGDYHRARVLYQESLTLHRRLGNKVYAAWCLEGLAAAASAEGQVEYAAYLCAAASALREAVGAPLPPSEQDHYDRTVAAVHAALGDELFKIAWAAGRKLSLEEAITYALADEA